MSPCLDLNAQHKFFTTEGSAAQDCLRCTAFAPARVGRGYSRVGPPGRPAYGGGVTAPTDQQGTPRDPEQTRAAILRAASEVVWSKGDAAVRVAKVARSAGVTTGAIYGHFGSREGLIAAVHTEFMHDLVGTVVELLGLIVASSNENPLVTDQYLEVIRASITGEQADMALRWAAAGSRSLHEPQLAASLLPIEREMVDGVAGIIELGQRDGWMRTDVDARAVAVVIFGAVIGLSVTTRAYNDVPSFTDEVVRAWPLLPMAFQPSEFS